MAEKIKLKSQNEIKSGGETLKPPGYGEQNNTRIYFEDESRRYYDDLKSELNKSKPNKYIVEDLKSSLETNELLLSESENHLARIEQDYKYEPGGNEESSRFFVPDGKDESKKDLLINSAIFYRERIRALRDSTDNPDIDKYYVNTIIEYARAVENDSNSLTLSRYEGDDLRKYIEACARRRSMCHNRMIEALNKLNGIARENGLKPLTYRDLATNSAANNFNNNPQQYHDRVTAIRYVCEVADFGFDDRMPDPKYLKET